MWSQNIRRILAYVVDASKLSFCSWFRNEFSILFELSSRLTKTKLSSPAPIPMLTANNNTSHFNQVSSLEPSKSSSPGAGMITRVEVKIDNRVCKVECRFLWKSTYNINQQEVKSSTVRLWLFVLHLILRCAPGSREDRLLGRGCWVGSITKHSCMSRSDPSERGVRPRDRADYSR